MRGSYMLRSNLKKIMNEKKVTYKELEARTGLSSQTITRARNHLIIECRMSTLLNIAQALDVKVKDLFSE
ncbi:helix-turn-helix domain-containing protein [Desulfovibrio falkowii]|uniref:HTH cro/C1-type domain-containing protein n=2 Tax=Desulfovibrio TaxID=872 RepID=A0ABQ0EB10_9BACT|nr:helix-turn-helix transcriptional regulator [Desulfovibrio desulfuricans]